MPGCIFMHTCIFPEKGTDRDPRCNMAPDTVYDKAACQQAVLCFHSKI